MELILDGSLESDAQAWNEIVNLIFLEIRLIESVVNSKIMLKNYQFSFKRALRVLSYPANIRNMIKPNTNIVPDVGNHNGIDRERARQYHRHINT